MITKETYIKTITTAFLEIGIKSVSMDDIAKRLGISKKTLYQIYKDKTDIVITALEYIKSNWLKLTDEYEKSTLNAIEREIEHLERYLSVIQKFKTTFLFDLQKFYPLQYEEFTTFKRELSYKSSYSGIVKGMKEGLYRDDLDPEFMAKYIVTISNATLNKEISAFSQEEILSHRYTKNFYKYHLYGICTEKGRNLFDKLAKEKDL